MRSNICISTVSYLLYLPRYGDPEAGLKYAEDLEKVILAAEARGRRIGAFLYEPMLVIPGVHTPPPGYYQHVFRLALVTIKANELKVTFVDSFIPLLSTISTLSTYPQNSAGARGPGDS